MKIPIVVVTCLWVWMSVAWAETPQTPAQTKMPPQAVKVERPDRPLKVKIKKTKDEIIWEVDAQNLEAAIRAAKRLQKEFP
ncbi:MAG: hypothetical protein HZA23_07720 [Nitrospirae bacterium]|nr:hypothetical protein [Nitrospirota bacterium]